MSSKTSVTLEFDIANMFSVLGASKYLGISRQTIWRWCRDGQIHYFQFDGHRFFHLLELNRIKLERDYTKEG